MRCSPLTVPQAALLIVYLIILFDIDALEISSRPLAILAVGLPMAVTMLLWRRSCALPVEER